MRVIGYRHQRTIATEATIEGVGFVTGACAQVCLRPAPANTGIVFHRADRPGTPAVPALAAFVTGTQRRTTLGPPDSGITLVEHLLAALAGLRIDNCEIEVDGPEPPGLDGSAADYVTVLEESGVVVQIARRPIWAVDSPVVVSANGATVGLHPPEQPGLRATYMLDCGTIGPIPHQTFTLDVEPEEFVREVAGCRTFVTAAEADALRSQGIGRHLSAADLLVFGDHGPIDNHLRFANEPARHKVLDMIGDLALCGFDLAGHVIGYRSGHALNVELARQLTALAGRAGSVSDRSSSTNQAA